MFDIIIIAVIIIDECFSYKNKKRYFFFSKMIISLLYATCKCISILEFYVYINSIFLSISILIDLNAIIISYFLLYVEILLIINYHFVIGSKLLEILGIFKNTKTYIALNGIIYLIFYICNCLLFMISYQ